MCYLKENTVMDSLMQKNEVGPLSYPDSKINSRWIENLNVRAKPIKILKESIGIIFTALGLAKS